MRFKVDWASLILGTKFSVFFVLLCIWGKFPSTSPPGGAYIWRGDLTKRFLRYELGWLIHEGAYFRNFTVFLHTYFVKCRRTLLSLNSKEPYLSLERNKISSLLVYVLHKTGNLAFSCRSPAKTAKKCTKKCAARAKLLFSCRSHRNVTAHDL